MAADPAGGEFIGLQLGRKLASLPQSGSIEPARRVIDELRQPLEATALALRGGAGTVSQSVAGDLAATTAVHVIAQVERELDAQVSMQNREAAATAAAQPATQGKSMSVSKTPKLNSLAGAFDSFTARVEAAADGVLKRMEFVGGGAENSVGKLDKAIDPIEQLVHQIDDTANQLTNGGPPLDVSAKP